LPCQHRQLSLVVPCSWSLGPHRPGRPCYCLRLLLVSAQLRTGFGHPVSPSLASDSMPVMAFGLCLEATAVQVVVVQSPADRALDLMVHTRRPTLSVGPLL